MTHHDPEIVSRNGNQVTLANILKASQPCATSTSGFADVSEAAFDHFTATLLQVSSFRTLHPLTVAVKRVLHAFRFILPDAITALAFGNVSANIQVSAGCQHFVRVISLISSDFPDHSN